MLKGIDVSYHNGSLDWNKIKSAGVDFAILRAGYGKLISQKDKKFEEYYSGAKQAGIPVGCYWYSYAKSVSEIQTEAEVFLQAIKGKQFEYPVYLDFEESSQFVLGRAKCSEMAKAFLEIVEKAGYFAGLYSSKSHLESYFTEDILTRYTVWVAHYGVSATTYKYPYAIWQFSETGTLNGISGKFDMDYCYADFPTAIKGLGLNGFKKEDSTVETVEKSADNTPTVDNVQNTTVKTAEGTAEPETNPANNEFIQGLTAEIISGVWGTDWKETVLSAIADCLGQSAPTEKYYRVMAGDTLTKIASKFNTTIDKLVTENKTAYPSMTRNFICVGWILKV